MILFFALLPVVALATWQVVETLHHGSIFAKARARCEAQNEFFCDLFLCPFCLSHWIALVMTLLTLQYFTQRIDPTFSEWSMVIVYAFAVTRLANVFNDTLHKWCRTPGRVKFDEGDLEELEEISQVQSELDSFVRMDAEAARRQQDEAMERAVSEQHTEDANVTESNSPSPGGERGGTG